MAGDPQRPLILGGMRKRGRVELQVTLFIFKHDICLSPFFYKVGVWWKISSEKRRGYLPKKKKSKLENHWFQRFLVPLSLKVL